MERMRPVRSYILYLSILILSTGACPAAYGRNEATVSDYKARKEMARDIVIAAPSPKLPEYERLTYQVKWLGVPVGTIVASIKGIKKIRGRDAYHLEVVVKTNAFCSAIYKVDDRFSSYMDVENNYTLRHEVYRREGKYKKDAVTDFDQVNHRAHFENFLDKSKKDFDITPNTQDTLTAPYYLRTLTLKMGDRVEYPVSNNESNYSLFGVLDDKTFLRIPRIGRRAAFHIQPYVKVISGSGPRKGRVSGYFSCDERRIPLLAVVEAPVFTKVIAYPIKIESRQKSK